MTGILVSGLGKALGGLQSYLIVGASAALIAGAGGAYAGYRWEEAKYEKLVANDAKALIAATKDAVAKQANIDKSNQRDAADQAYFRGKLDGTVLNIVTGAPLNVTVTQDKQAAVADHAGCITYGFARLLYSGAHGVAPDSLPIPSGESVDSCTALEPSELAAAVAQDLAAGYGNAHQLDSLIAAVTRNDAIATTTQ